MKNAITLQPVAFVHNSRTVLSDDFWGNIRSEIRLVDDVPEEAFDHVEDFSHLEIIYFFHEVGQDTILFSGHPRGNPAFPKCGIFAQRKKDRPNRLGLCRARLEAHQGRSIWVSHLDAIDGTPVLDIKPVLIEFEPGGSIIQPVWSIDIMKDYWKP